MAIINNNQINHHFGSHHLNEQLYIGLMSGTSLDGIDAVLVSFAPARSQLLFTHHQPLPDALKQALTRLTRPGPNEIETLIYADVEMGRCSAQAVQALLDKSPYTADKIVAIGSHGQTIRHQPHGLYPSSLQIGDPNIIAEQTGITTVGDFRRRDIACSGQGAPLVPAFHADVFHHPQKNRLALNIGGIANITLIPSDLKKPVTGFDTGPGNTLMDNWIYKHQGLGCDTEGQWAAQGKIQEQILRTLLEDPYFSKRPPKSTGREYFHLDWLYQLVPGLDQENPADIQATLCELTAVTIAQNIQNFASGAHEVLVSGGGAHNKFLMERIKSNLTDLDVNTSDICGIPVDWVEAVAFAWLARQTIEGLPGNLPAVTGAHKAAILGGIYRCR